LSAKFDERLAAHKHAQQRELEQLRFEINALMDRTVKLHQREFDVIPEAWSRLNDAFHATEPVGLGFHQYPDVNRMTRAQFEGLLERSDLQDWEKAELREADDKTAYYSRATARIAVWKAHQVCSEFAIYFAKNGIFMPEPMKAKFKAIEEVLWAAVVERRLYIQHPELEGNPFEKGSVLHQQGPAMLRALEADVQARLWSSDQGRVA
jgi:hypothetical protein